jgi:transposase
MRPVSDKKRSNVISALQQGLSVRQVAERCGVSKSLVQKIRVQYGPDIPALSPGRPAKLSSQDKRCCIRAVTSGRQQTAVAVAKMLKEELHIEASPMTVRRAFREGGLGSIEKKPKPMLSAKNIKARLDFANLHKDWTVEDWKRIIWSDETKINRFCSDGRAWAWISDGQKLQPYHVKQTVKHGGGSLMVWGCMTAQGPGFMCRIDGTMTKDVYLDILKDELQQSIEYYGLNPDQVIFQHDNDPKHTALLVREWIDKQPFQTLEWPAQSPDLNPIETLWAVLKGRLNEYERAPKGMIELWERIEEVWNQIKPETCLKLIKSMPKRIQDVLDAKGRWTDN